MERNLQVIERRCFQVCVTGCVEEGTGLAGKFEYVVFIASSTGFMFWSFQKPQKRKRPALLPREQALGRWYYGRISVWFVPCLLCPSELESGERPPTPNHGKRVLFWFPKLRNSHVLSRYALNLCLLKLRAEFESVENKIFLKYWLGGTDLLATKPKWSMFLNTAYRECFDQEKAALVIIQNWRKTWRYEMQIVWERGVAVSSFYPFHFLTSHFVGQVTTFLISILFPLVNPFIIWSLS